MPHAADGSLAGRRTPLVHRGPGTRYALIALSLAGVVALRWVLHPVLGDSLRFALVYGPVALAVWLVGWRSAASVAVAGFLAFDYLFSEPTLVSALLRGNAADLITLLAYAFISAIIIGLGTATRRAADQAAAHERTSRALEQSLEDSQLLQRLTLDLGASRPTGELYARLLQAARRMLGSDFATLQLLHAARPGSEAAGMLEMVAQEGLDPGIAEQWRWVTLDTRNPCALALRDQRRCEIADCLADDRITASERAALVAADIRAMQSTPLVSRSGRVIGTLSTQWRAPRPGGPLPARDDRLLDVLARHAADLLERLQAEAMLRRTKTTLFNLVSDAPIGVYVVDQDFRIAHVSRGAQPAFRNVRPLIGHDFAAAMRTLWPEPFATEAVGHFRHTLETGAAYVAPTLTQQRQDLGITESYEWELHRIGMPDGSFGVVCYFFESTQIRQAELALREADRRKDEFLATLAHELRNPLAPLVSSLELLDRIGSTDPQVAATRRTMHRQLHHLQRLVEDLLDVSRISRDKLELRRQRVDLRTVVQAAIEATRPPLEALGHRLHVTLPPDPVWLEADPDRLAQVFSNLVGNAGKFTPPGGQVAVAVEREGKDVRVAVRDTGVGIPPAQLDEVFTMFTQVGPALDRERAGLGIGLHLVRRLVELHGGRVEARSDGEGRGAEFLVRLTG
ncbi:MAG: DUF4118 domain-containing protein, partial [Gammaproteobacteria bacterium]|nr:DUF4118 domain-containing protein [Gammaproteobacteria bacterium]